MSSPFTFRFHFKEAEHYQDLNLTASDVSSLTLDLTVSDHFVNQPAQSAFIGLPGAGSGARVFVKFAWEEEQLNALGREAEVYKYELRNLQGTVVPKCYGQGYLSDSAGVPMVECLVFEFLEHTLQVIQDYNRHLMLAACKLHKAGIVHNRLNRIESRARNIITVAGQNPIRFVGFSKASSHHCANGVPVLRNGEPEGPFCPELMMLESVYGMSDGALVPPQPIERQRAPASMFPVSALASLFNQCL